MASSAARVLVWDLYFEHPQEVGRLIETTAPSSDLWTPAVLLCGQDAGFASEHAQKALGDFVHRDGVFCDDFTSAVILQSRQGIDITTVATRLAKGGRFQGVYTSEPVLTHDPLPQGPNFIHSKSIHQA
ncbi:hypothetical protein B0T26DRAFT_672443 [Lasiosphaeria miniovina]|uniref:Uncharacterized protein n=1 Tax=Lasiosphaeria miniovina TaxID=1954250 RepID=A0AA40B4Z1_9PEZI|nr:uncharacterized protein B0T26DRAFT_672443 [Lasiosphaeria miniovina]KAK0727825.1 hypothetical protein B0T26DRAFT_672443 [Lasiosphaeria miniovina]